MFRTNLLFSQYYWDLNQFVNRTDESDVYFKHDVYLNGEIIRPKLEDMYNISLGLLQGQYIKDDSLLRVSSRRLTIATNPPLNLTISRERIQDYRLQQPAEYFQSLTPVPTIMRSEFIYPDAALEYFLSDGPVKVFTCFINLIFNPIDRLFEYPELNMNDVEWEAFKDDTTTWMKSALTHKVFVILNALF